MSFHPQEYQVDARCYNCGEKETGIFVPKGTKADEFLKDQICRNCGCKMLKSIYHWIAHGPLSSP